MAVELTPRWFLSGTEYNREAATFGLLVNGEEAFRAVHQAIESAKRSVAIICWGFQPSMHFIRDGRSPCIGELLERKARAGVKVRILSWTMEFSVLNPPVDMSVGVTGLSGEPTTPGRRALAVSDRLPGMTNEQFEYNRQWFGLYDAQTDATVKRAIRRLYRLAVQDATIENLVFRGRGFSAPDRTVIALHDYLDRNLSTTARAFMAGTATHHQKVVLVDHESQDDAVGFVMGHNMLDLYWDTNAHSMRGRPSAPNAGPNAPLPRQDISCRVTGPILADLYDNFQAAWNKVQIDDPGHAAPDILPQKPRVTYAQQPRQEDVPLMAQIARTQSQAGVRDIKKLYLESVVNATRFIYIENQYFRWPPLAEKIKEHAKKMAQWGRRPERDGGLYLFVITNTSEDGMGAGAQNTQRMLENLGRGGALPAATRDARIERGELVGTELDEYKTRQAAVDAERQNIQRLEAERRAIDREVQLLAGAPGTAQAITQRYESVNQRLAAAQQRSTQAQAALDEWTERTISAKEVETPGLKTLVCRLVATDTPAGAAWVETYVHAKLMIIDDTFMTLGSANINSRSMESDSELNILHDRPEVSQPARQKLWDMHTFNWGRPSRIADLPLDQAYLRWSNIMQENRSRRSKGLSPVAPLDAFLRLDPSRKDWD